MYWYEYIVQINVYSDSKIEQNFAMSEYKLKYRINYGLHHILKLFQRKDIEGSHCFVVSVDVSLRIN